MICNFCFDIFAKNREHNLPEEESILYQDNNIYVMPDISPLTIGHLLIISKKHFNGFANADKDTIDSLRIFLDFYKERIKGRIYTIFEHGAVIPYHAGASIDHAHMHILPYAIEIKEKINGVYSNGKECKIEELNLFKIKKQSYFFCMKSNEDTGWAFEVGKVPSQILRKFANELLKNDSEYNWKLQYKKSEVHIDYFKTLIWWRNLAMVDSFKWKKKLLLEKYEFISYRNLLEEVNRFLYEQKELMELLLNKELEISKKKCVFRVILVSQGHLFQLPNHIVKDKLDVKKLEEFYDNNIRTNEIWYLKNRKEETGVYSGRICIIKQRELYEYIIEIVLGDDLRKLEQYSVGENCQNYFRARKLMGKFFYEIEDNFMNENNEILQVFEYVKKELMCYSKKIQRFCQYLEHCGINVLSMDFRIENKEIVFIDWDTLDDEKVLNYK